MAKTIRREADVTATLACNNDCVFCPRDVLRSIHVPSPALCSSLKAMRAEADAVVLTGGEVTIRKDFLDLVSYCRELGYSSVGIVTNGRMLSREGFAAEALEAGLTDAAVSIYSHEPEVHDKITRVKGSCLQSWLGLARALAARADGRALRLRSNIVVSSYNIDGLVETLQRLVRLGLRSLLLIDPVSEDGGASLVDHARVVELFDDLRHDPAFTGVKVAFRGYPACIFGDQMGREGALRAPHGDWRWEPFDLESTPGYGAAEMRRYRRRVASRYRRVKACTGCDQAKACPGFQADYLRRFIIGGRHGSA